MKKTPYLESKTRKISKYVLIWTIFLLILCLCGCAKKDPVESIVDNHSEHISETLEYAYNNFEQTAEVKYLENELESCLVVLEDVKQAHYSKLDICEVKTDLWKVVAFFLGLSLLVGVFLKVRGIFK